MCKDVVTTAVNKDKVPNVGIHFMKFCSKWNLQRLSDQAGDFGDILNSDIINNMEV